MKDWHNQRAEEDLNQSLVEMEMKAMENAVTIQRGAIRQYSNPARGQDHEDISVPDGRAGKQGGQSI